MISITSLQLDAWMAAFFYPLTRILALFASAPLWSSAAMPRRTRLILALAVTIGLAPSLPVMPDIAPASTEGLWILAQQFLIGLGMGFSMRIVYLAIDLAGSYIGFQMGLGFATFYDPTSASQTGVMAEFMGLMALLAFLSINGHLMYVATLSQSFVAIPVGATPLGSGSWLNVAELGSKIFSGGLLLALPVIVALIITNIALGVLTRAAPQLNLFAVGFPLTLMGGFLALGLALNYLSRPMLAVFEFGLSAMLGFAQPR
ncbi:MAG: Flagellar biosynthetic protein FliR [Betaproteobacteria bacterium ADurb.Bin341]|nr:MAG: Flagellar biosynthetic protein FliR [Betaproteobacteria bacterium ADurb.Bin341]